MNEDDARFCVNCGANLQQSTVEEAYTPVYEENVVNEQTEPAVQKDNLGLSIAGLILAAAGSAFGITSIAGLIISIIGLSKARKNAMGDVPRGKNKVAKILSTIGIPVAIVTLLIFLFTVIVYPTMLAELFKDWGGSGSNAWA